MLALAVRFLLLACASQEKETLKADEVVLATLPEGAAPPETLELDGQFHPRLGPRIAFSIDGKRVAYRQPVKDRVCVVVNGESHAQYEHVTIPRFLPDGRVAYRARVKQFEEFAVIDGKPQKTWCSVGSLAWTGDGKTIAYSASDDDDALFLVVNETAQKCPDDAEEIRHLAFDPNGRATYFLVMAKDYALVMGDGTTTKLGRNHRPSSPVFFHGDHSAYVMNEDLHFKVIVDGKATGLRVRGLVEPTSSIFGPKGEIVLTGGDDKGRSFVHVADTKHGPYESAGEVHFSPDGTSLGFSGCEHLKEGECTPFALTIDSKGKAERHPGAKGVLFLPDNRPVLSMRGDGKEGRHWFEIGARKTREYDWVSEPVVEKASGTMRFGARDGRKLVWVTLKP